MSGIQGRNKKNTVLRRVVFVALCALSGLNAQQNTVSPLDFSVARVVARSKQLAREQQRAKLLKYGTYGVAAASAIVLAYWYFTSGKGIATAQPDILKSGSAAATVSDTGKLAVEDLKAYELALAQQQAVTKSRELTLQENLLAFNQKVREELQKEAMQPFLSRVLMASRNYLATGVGLALVSPLVIGSSAVASSTIGVLYERAKKWFDPLANTLDQSFNQLHEIIGAVQALGEAYADPDISAHDRAYYANRLHTLFASCLMVTEEIVAALLCTADTATAAWLLGEESGVRSALSSCAAQVALLTDTRESAHVGRALSSCSERLTIELKRATRRILATQG